MATFEPSGNRNKGIYSSSQKQAQVIINNLFSSENKYLRMSNVIEKVGFHLKAFVNMSLNVIFILRCTLYTKDKVIRICK